MKRKKVVLFLLGFLFYMSTTNLQTLNHNNQPWWHGAVIYEIYPRSFQDSNGDGIGDLQGIISRLDYLVELGIDAIWLTPIYPSPNLDWGYDISDYYNIAPEFGTLKDFDQLIEQAHKRGIRIIMDLVLNHTSEEHPWFKEARSSKTSPYRNWYMWHDGIKGANGKPQPPNNWTALFGGSTWEWDETTQQFYYHFFFKEQPDLNWRNPELKKAMFDVIRFWLKRGVDGFRLDAIAAAFEDPYLRDNPNLFLRPDGSWEQERVYNNDQPEIHDLLRELRKEVETFGKDKVLLGEVEALTLEKICEYFGKENDGLHLAMNFFVSYVDRLSAKHFHDEIEQWDKNTAGGTPYYFFSNHDKRRHFSRYGDGINDDKIARLMATLLLTVRGTIQMYYGEEIGMHSTIPTEKASMKDPLGHIFWPDVSKCRDAARTPMQWDASKYAGFTKKNPWLPVNPDHEECNVQQQQPHDQSLLTWYKHLIQVRKNHPALKIGQQEAMAHFLDNNVLAFTRRHDQEVIVVLLNFSEQPQEVILHNVFESGTYQHVTTLLSTSKETGSTHWLSSLRLEPFEGFVGTLG